MKMFSKEQNVESQLQIALFIIHAMIIECSPCHWMFFLFVFDRYNSLLLVDSVAACGGVPLFVDDWGNPCSIYINIYINTVWFQRRREGREIDLFLLQYVLFLCIFYLSRVSTYMYTGIQYLMIYFTHTSIQTIVCFSL